MLSIVIISTLQSYMVSLSHHQFCFRIAAIASDVHPTVAAHAVMAVFEAA
jgi:hypothetical protein